MAAENKNQPASCCDDCFYFDYLYDDDSDDMGCTVSMDEDELIALASNGKGCPYYRYHDEYKTVQKQN